MRDDLNWTEKPWLVNIATIIVAGSIGFFGNNVIHMEAQRAELASADAILKQRLDRIDDELKDIHIKQDLNTNARVELESQLKSVQSQLAQVLVINNQNHDLLLQNNRELSRRR